MNVLLVAARRSPYTGEWITAPFQGLLSLAAVLRAETFRPTRGVRLTIVDEQIEFLRDPAAPAGWWLNGHQPNVVGVQACTSSLKNALALLRAARARFPGVLTVLGGPGLARGAEVVLQQGGVDVVVEGEGEVTFSELIDAFGNGGRAAIGGVDGIVYLSDDGVPIRGARRRCAAGSRHAAAAE